jgi:hypothetical protein
MIPPIATKRVLFFFSDQRMEWSESYYFPPTSATSAALLEAVTKLAKVRLPLLGVGVLNTEIRASDDTVFRDSQISRDYSQWGGFPGGSNSKRIYDPQLIEPGVDKAIAAPPTVVLRLRQEGRVGDQVLGRHRRIVPLSGWPESIEVDQGNVPPYANKQWGVNFQRFIDYFKDNATIWGFPVFKNPPEKTSQVFSITRVANNGVITVQHAILDQFPVGSTVEIFRPRFQGGSLKIQGKYEVLTSQLGSFTTLDPRVGVVTYLDGGVVQLVTRDFATIQDVIPDGFGIRKRGAAELAPRGRSRTRKAFAG